MSDPNANNSQDGQVVSEDSQDFNDSVSIEQELPPASRRLSEARIALDLSQEQIAEKLFLQVSKIRYIDEGRFDKIGKPAFLKGYLRSYARELGLSGDEIVALLGDHSGVTDESQPGLHRVGKQKNNASNATPAAATATYGLVGVALVLFVIWWMNPEDQEQDRNFRNAEENRVTELQPADVYEPYAADNFENSVKSQALSSAETASTENESEEDVEVSLADSEIPSADGDDEGNSETPAEERQLSISADQPEDVSESIPESVQEVQISRHVEDDLNIITVTAGGEGHLSFEFTEDCWLEVVDAGGQTIYGDLNHDRELLNVYGTPPFNVLIGRVSAVTVTYNGETVELLAHTFNDTAKLVIE
jgi:cytoskeleton protein RodZ